MRLLRSITILLHVRYILCVELSGKTIAVDGTFGGSVALHLNEEDVDDVTWSYKHNRIASTGPHKPINVTSTYTGKLASEQDGSLVILNLRREDEGTYDASIKLRTGVMCTAHYQLHVYKALSGDEIKISHNVFSHEPCRVTLTCTVNGSDVTITWTSSDIIINNNVVNVTDPDPKTVYICTAQNPISGANMFVTPWDFCEEGNRTWTVIVSVFVAVVTTAVVSYLCYCYREKLRSQCRRCIPGSGSDVLEPSPED